MGKKQKAETKVVPLPCPFCGSTDIEVRSYDIGVLCRNCSAWMPSVMSTDPKAEHGALEGWNRRANEIQSGVNCKNNKRGKTLMEVFSEDVQNGQGEVKIDRRLFWKRDRVKWTSQSLGCKKTKCGKVVAIVPAGECPGDFVPIGLRCGYVMGFGQPRDHESYLVQVDGKGSTVYWPRVSHLKGGSRDVK